jgi:lysophospholipase L1-like esterase
MSMARRRDLLAWAARNDAACQRAERGITPVWTRGRQAPRPLAGEDEESNVTPAGWRGRWKVTRLIRFGLLGAAVLLVLAATIAAFADYHLAARRGSGGDRWVTSWSASPQVATPGTLAAVGFDNQTVRDIIVTSVGGDPIRLELTNVFGTSPLEVGHVTVAMAGPGPWVAPGTIHQVTFGGRVSFQIPAGAQILSDPVAMRVWPLQDLAVSVYLPGPTGAATFHSDAQQVNWVSATGDYADQDAGVFPAQTQSWYYLSGLIVRSSGAEGTVVAFGDSITDGFGSTVGANARWPNDLAGRLDALNGPTLSVADEGISGNQVLTGSLWFGASAEARFGRDALDQPGVRDIIVLEGINDIGFSAVPPHPGTEVTAAHIIAGYQQLIAQAHARGLKIFGATLLPFQGAGYYTAAGEAKREAVNAWIRTSGAFDGVIDFDALMRDPAHPSMINPAYDSGDHLHPNDAGYQAMANAISLKMLLPQPR